MRGLLPQLDLLTGVPRIDRVADTIASADMETIGDAGLHFQHRPHRILDSDSVERQRDGVFRDRNNPAGVVEKHHIERNVGVEHPHRDLLRRAEIEQHAGIVGKPATPLKTLLARCGRVRDLDRERETAALGREDQHSGIFARINRWRTPFYRVCCWRRRAPQQRRSSKREDKTEPKPAMLSIVLQGVRFRSHLM